MSIEDNFRQFASNLEISRTEQIKAARLQEEICEILEKRDNIVKTELSGSYDRKTKIRPLHDIDILVILDPTNFYDSKGNPLRPISGLNEIFRAIPDLKRKYSGLMNITRQNRSINITLQDVGFDLVPAYELNRGGYLIPDRKLATWIETDPIGYAKLLTSKNKSPDYTERLIPFIKMMKSWANNRAPYLKSYLTEILVLKAIDYIRFYTQTSFQFFAYAAGLIISPVIDPVTGQDVNELKKEERINLSGKLSRFAQMAAKAIITEGQGNIKNAALHWKIIFGREFPAT